MRFKSIVILSSGFLALSATGCTKQRALRYDDDVDVAGLQVAFACAKSPTGDRAEACRIIGDFATGVPFEAFPAKGLETWFGRMVCTDSLDANDRIDLPFVYLHPGIGKPLFPADVTTEPARDIAHGALFIPGSASFKDPAMKAGYLEMMAAAKEGREPVFTGFSSSDADFLQLGWDGRKTPPGPDYYRLTRSKGRSITEGQMTTGERGASALQFIRANGARMIVAQPGGYGGVPCVSELWKTFVAP